MLAVLPDLVLFQNSQIVKSPDLRKKVLFVSGSFESLESLEDNIRKLPFYYDITFCKITVCISLSTDYGHPMTVFFKYPKHFGRLGRSAE